MSWPDAVSAVCAVLSILGAAFAWWRANLSKKAKTGAETARDEAAAALRAAQETAAALREMAAKLPEPPRFTLRPASSSPRNTAWILASARDEPQTITEVVNGDKVPMLNGLEAPLTLGPGEPVQFQAFAYGAPMPPSLVLRVEGVEGLVHVPFH
ncbi:hypothetical protein [Propionibacterium acidifaciens]|uniref:hypothetical protein n=1 Tax=Propionibacterium acidifaciens TaxID=556499 RepID=UPI003620DE52